MSDEMILVSAKELKAFLESVPDGVIVTVTVERKEAAGDEAQSECESVQHQ